tara:strand:+ start:133 stop:735 length:603 start_codon:yes stop_codon:yes gene_type:complete
MLKIKTFVVIFLLCINLAFSQQLLDPLKISDSAIELTNKMVTYDGAYYSIPYPNGDVPDGIGVCTDVVIRTYRAVGLDLQKEVHEDMKANFKLYPQLWNLKRPDKNIDHRRVPNLMKYFKRQGAEISITDNGKDYLPGDVVSWDLGGGLTHIGVVVDKKSNDNKRFMIVHNIGGGQVLEDCLFNFTINGHYRFIKIINSN